MSSSARGSPGSFPISGWRSFGRLAAVGDGSWEADEADLLPLPSLALPSQAGFFLQALAAGLFFTAMMEALADGDLSV